MLALIQTAIPDSIPLPFLMARPVIYDVWKQLPASQSPAPAAYNDTR